MIKRFNLFRKNDPSGVSGLGYVAEGCLFEDTKECIVHWFGPHPSINIYHSVDAVLAVHGHLGATELIWIDKN